MIVDGSGQRSTVRRARALEVVSLVLRPLAVERLVPRTASVLAGELKRLLIGNLRSWDEKLRTLMRVTEHRPRMYKGGNCQFTTPPYLSQNLLYRTQAKKIGNRVFRKEIPLKKKVKKSQKKDREKGLGSKAKGSTSGNKSVQMAAARKWAVDVVEAWKALPPSEGDRASALKMADEDRGPDRRDLTYLSKPLELTRVRYTRGILFAETLSEDVPRVVCRRETEVVAFGCTHRLVCDGGCRADRDGQGERSSDR
ncbi:hypothetical protein Scep_017387 [Stephania cephalantha]|uniref:Uncharacterized protein n=1 Tax=Stephania cephalantha TaxID=152367 RepID=A0AAP0IPC3_9MAGN